MQRSPYRYLLLLSALILCLGGTGCGETDDEEDAKRSAATNYLNASDLTAFDESQIKLGVDFCRALDKKKIEKTEVYDVSSRKKLCGERVFSVSQTFKLKIVEESGKAPVYEYYTVDPFDRNEIKADEDFFKAPLIMSSDWVRKFCSHVSTFQTENSMPSHIDEGGFVSRRHRFEINQPGTEKCPSSKSVCIRWVYGEKANEADEAYQFQSETNLTIWNDQQKKLSGHEMFREERTLCPAEPGKSAQSRTLSVTLRD